MCHLAWVECSAKGAISLSQFVINKTLLALKGAFWLFGITVLYWIIWRILACSEIKFWELSQADACKDQRFGAFLSFFAGYEITRTSERMNIAWKKKSLFYLTLSQSLAWSNSKATSPPRPLPTCQIGLKSQEGNEFCRQPVLLPFAHLFKCLCNFEINILWWL